MGGVWELLIAFELSYSLALLIFAQEAHGWADSMELYTPSRMSLYAAAQSIGYQILKYKHHPMSLACSDLSACA